jgi:hypothetical protein
MSSVQDWCDTCAGYRTGEILERNAEPRADRFGDVQVVRAACPKSSGPHLYGGHKSPR